MTKSTFILLASLLLGICLQAQSDLRPIEIISDHEINVDLGDSLLYARSINDANDKAVLLLNELQQQQYIFASIDSVYEQDSSLYFKVYRGDRIAQFDINTKKIASWILPDARITNNDLNTAVRSDEDFQLLTEQLLTHLENNGYPLASVKLDSVRIKKDTLRADLLIDLKSSMRYDSLSVVGDLRLSKAYLRNYLGFKSGKDYNQSELLRYEKKLKELPFLKLKSTPKVSFYGNNAVVTLPLDKKQASRFDFIIGVLPQESDGAQNFTLAVDLDTELYNSLGYGEKLALEFKRLRPETQDLTIDINYPFLLDLPFGVELGLDIFRNSQDYIELDFDIGWQYFFNGINNLKAFWHIYSSRLLEVDTMSIISSGKLPQQLDVKYNAFGLKLDYQQLDYRFNPKKGFSIKTSASTGIKEIIPNNNILELSGDNIDFSSAYDSLSNASIQLRIENKAEYFIPLSINTTLMLASNTGFLWSKEQIFENEFYRIGGYRLLRGFDEESLFGQFYQVMSVEYRLLLDQNSYLVAFIDQGFINNEFGASQWDRPIGIGGGLSLQTKAGIFGINMAVGQRRDIPFNFRNAKVHFGFKSIF